MDSYELGYNRRFLLTTILMNRKISVLEREIHYLWLNATLFRCLYTQSHFLLDSIQSLHVFLLSPDIYVTLAVRTLLSNILFTCKNYGHSSFIKLRSSSSSSHLLKHCLTNRFVSFTSSLPLNGSFNDDEIDREIHAESKCWCCTDHLNEPMLKECLNDLSIIRCCEWERNNGLTETCCMNRNTMLKPLT